MAWTWIIPLLMVLGLLAIISLVVFLIRKREKRQLNDEVFMEMQDLDKEWERLSKERGW